MTMLAKLKSNKFFRKSAIIFLNLLSVVNHILPKNDRKILLYDSARDFLDDNTEALYTWLKKEGYDSKYKIYVYVANQKVNNSKYVNIGLLRGVLEFLTAKYVFFSFGDFRIRPSKKQVVINQWHGSPAKCIGKMTNDEKYQKEKLDNFSYILSSSDLFVPIMAKAFGCSEDKVMVMGNARNDYLFSSKDTLSLLDIKRSEYKKMFLWMPTFRQSKDKRFQDGDTEVSETMLPILFKNSDLKALDDYLCDLNVLLVIKIHPLAMFKENRYRNIITVTNDDLFSKDVRLYEFVKEFDALLTDYSSIYFDYLILNRPIGFTLDDYEKYKSTRGFVFDNMIEYMPGHHIYSFGDFKQYISDVLNGVDIYEEKRNKCKDLFQKYTDNHNCERLFEQIGIRI